MPRTKGQPWKIDIAGQKFGRWTVVSRAHGASWDCVCDCGTRRVVTGSSLKLGTSPSCGCLSRERSTKHGMERTQIYNTWAQMLARCNNPKSTSYPRYGAKGIKVCVRWHDFRSFYADMGDKAEGQTLDRIDGSKGYEPGNVRWANKKEQARNRTSTKFLMWEGKPTPMAEVAERAGIKRKVLENRIRLGMSVEDAVKKIRYTRWNTPTKAVC